MGHVRLGKMPATRKWREVIALLDEDEPSIPSIADSVQRAADRSLADAVNDPVFVEALWLLLKIPKAARSPDFVDELGKLGVRVGREPTFADLLGAFDRALEKARLKNHSKTTDFGVLARNAAVTALQGALQDRLPTLWSATAEDERTTLATLVSTERFGDLAQRFFTHLLQGHIHYFLDREIPRHIGPGSFVQSIADTVYFDQAVLRHCMETTFITRAFARDWLGKNQFHSDRNITRENVAAFASYAFTKIRNELEIRGARQ